MDENNTEDEKEGSDCTDYDPDFVEREMTEERLLALAADPKCEMRGIWGGKRGRAIGSDNDEHVKNRIQEFIGEINEKPTDSMAVKTALAAEVDIEAWINELSLKDAEKLKELTLKHENRGNNDFALLNYVQHLPELVAVEASSI